MSAWVTVQRFREGFHWQLAQPAAPAATAAAAAAAACLAGE